MQKYLIFIIFFLFAVSVSAQQYTITGRVMDNMTGEALPSATVTLLTTDSVPISTTITNVDEINDRLSGRFTIWIPGEKMPKKGETKTFVVKCSYLGFSTVYKNATIKRSREMEFSLGNIGLKEQVQAKKGVVIKASKIKMVLRGDTIIYNADAFRLAEGSMLDALIEQLPGAELRDNGEILINGRHVDELMLNGRDFFKGNPKVALENLPAYTVHNIKVYDKTGNVSKLMGRDMGDKSFVLDVNLKKEFQIGWIVNMEGAEGVSVDKENRNLYLARLFALRFTPRSRITLFSNVNNVNDKRKPGRNGEWNPTDMPRGKQNNKTVGASYSYSDLKNNLSFSSDNIFDRSTINVQSRTSSQTYLVGGDIYGLSQNDANNRITSIDSKNYFSLLGNKILWNAAINLNYNHITAEEKNLSVHYSDIKDLSFDSFDSIFFSPINHLDVVNRLQTLDKRRKNGLFSEVNVSGRFKMGADLLQVSLGVNYGDNDDIRHSIYLLDYSNKGTEADHEFLYNKNRDKNLRYNAEAKYTYYLGKDQNNRLTPFYTYERVEESSNSPFYRQDTDISLLPSDMTVMSNTIDEKNSYDYDRKKQTHTIGLSLVFNHKTASWANHTFSVDLPLQMNIDKLDYNSQINQIVERKDYFFNPSINYSWMKARKFLLVNARLTSSAPSMLYFVNQEQSRNKLAIRRGNPDLKNIRNLNVGMSFSNVWGGYKQHFNVGTTWIVTDNAIAQSFLYDTTTGARIYTPKNVKGNWRMTSDFGYGQNLKENGKLSFDNKLSHIYIHSIDLVDEVRSKVNTNTFSDILKLDWEPTVWGKIGLTNKIQVSHVSGDLLGFQAFTAADYNSSLNALVTLPWNMQLSTDFGLYCHSGYADKNLNTKDFVWNARLTKSAFKGLLVLQLDGFDLLSQLSNHHYTVNSQGRTEVWENSLPRYVMFHLQWKFNKQPKKKVSSN